MNENEEKEILRIEKQMIDYQHKHIKLFNDNMSMLNRIALDMKTVKEHSTKKFFIILFIVFLSGYTVGTQHKVISPYIKGFANMVKNVFDLSKKLN